MANQNLKGIPETLLIAVWARAAATQDENPIIQDHKAVEMISQIDYDFSRFESSNKFTKLGVAIRTMILDNALSEFLHKHPNTTVINFGAGLDTRHARLKCEDIEWYEIDVPETIELRRRFFRETSHYHFIAQSMFDMSWIEKINVAGKSVVFLAEGLLMYFSEAEIKPFFCELAKRFPKAEMFFEMLAPFLVGKSKHHETVRKIDTKAEFKWGMKDTRKMETWDTSIHIVNEWNYYDYYPERWGMFGKFARFPFIRPYFACRIVHLNFRKPIKR